MKVTSKIFYVIRFSTGMGTVLLIREIEKFIVGSVHFVKIYLVIHVFVRKSAKKCPKKKNCWSKACILLG